MAAVAKIKLRWRQSKKVKSIWLAKKSKSKYRNVIASEKKSERKSISSININGEKWRKRNHESERNINAIAYGENQ